MSARTLTLRSLLRRHRQSIHHTSRCARRNVSQLSARPLAVHTVSTSGQWIRYSTPYSISSVRTFSTGTALRNATPVGSDADAAKRIDEAMESIQELYGSALDEFEIAAEETDKNTTYAAEDRIAAREEVDKLLVYYKAILEGEDEPVKEEVKRKVGGKIRELEEAMLGLEEVGRQQSE